MSASLCPLCLKSRGPSPAEQAVDRVRQLCLAVAPTWTAVSVEDVLRALDGAAATGETK